MGGLQKELANWIIGSVCAFSDDNEEQEIDFNWIIGLGRKILAGCGLTSGGIDVIAACLRQHLQHFHKHHHQWHHHNHSIHYLVTAIVNTFNDFIIIIITTVIAGCLRHFFHNHHQKHKHDFFFEHKIKAIVIKNMFLNKSFYQFDQFWRNSRKISIFFFSPCVCPNPTSLKFKN